MNQLIDTQISFGNKHITNTHSTKYLGLTVDTSLSQKCHTEELNKACYAVRSVKPFMSLEVLRMTYFSHVHSILSYDIIFGGNSSYSKSIFGIQKRTVRVIMSSGMRDCCCELLRQLNILLLQSQYVFSLLLYIIKNTDQFLSNSEV